MILSQLFAVNDSTHRYPLPACYNRDAVRLLAQDDTITHGQQSAEQLVLVFFARARCVNIKRANV